ncbi:dCTP deaminase [Vulcanococcus sp.]|uniref:dCTP deaminase n=1 Tax=Vulcanococcus sp. TaxID=2856995 RepID=UPI003C020B13
MTDPSPDIGSNSAVQQQTGEPVQPARYYQPLVDHQIMELIELGCIQRANPSLVNPASINLRIGRTAKIEVPSIGPEGYYLGSTMEQISLDQTTGGQPFFLEPGAFLLTDVMEELNLPDDIEAQVILRSSAGRLGFDHAASGFVDPGFKGVLTLEFTNVRRWQKLPVFTGQQLVQLRLFRLVDVPERGYGLTGRYQHSMMTEGNRDLEMSSGIS